MGPFLVRKGGGEDTLPAARALSCLATAEAEWDQEEALVTRLRAPPMKIMGSTASPKPGLAEKSIHLPFVCNDLASMC